ncbi:hypothetical protein WAE61_09555 [Comamonadaceae bacterium PP-2]
MGFIDRNDRRGRLQNLELSRVCIASRCRATRTLRIQGAVFGDFDWRALFSVINFAMEIASAGAAQESSGLVHRKIQKTATMQVMP